MCELRKYTCFPSERLLSHGVFISWLIPRLVPPIWLMVSFWFASKGRGFMRYSQRTIESFLLLLVNKN
jgi:hypothetical protein